jgi:hypothetical protein
MDESVISSYVAKFCCGYWVSASMIRFDEIGRSKVVITEKQERDRLCLGVGGPGFDMSDGSRKLGKRDPWLCR